MLMKIIIVFTLLFSPSLMAKEFTLPCIGDSLTEGGSTHSTCRHFIDKYINQKLVHIGPFHDQKSLRHAGRGGWSVQRMVPKFKSWYTQYPADIIILHANHNNFAEQKPIPAILKAQENIIRQAHALNPEVIILFETAIPSLKLPKYSYLSELREAQKMLCTSLQKDKIKLHPVRPEIDFDLKWLSKDKVHLKDAGVDHMARCFTETINKVIK